MKKNIRKVRGQGTVEWILILAVIVGFVMIFGNGIKSKIKDTVKNVFDTVDGSVKGLSKE
jgi:hypothetical protein